MEKSLIDESLLNLFSRSSHDYFLATENRSMSASRHAYCFLNFDHKNVFSHTESKADS